VPPGGPRRSPLPVIAVSIAAVALVGAGIGAYILIGQSSSSSSGTTGLGSQSATGTGTGNGPASPTQSSSSAPPPTTPPTSQGTAEKTAATSLAGLLSQSSQDRNAINAAYNDGISCGNLSADQSTFQQASANRQSLLNQLGSLQGASTLPSSMISDLTSAWQASIQADNDYAQWLGDENTSGCTQQDSYFQAATTPNNQATTYKSAFINQWNPIAAQFGLTEYNQSTL
jgi:hypothetical protein